MMRGEKKYVVWIAGIQEPKIVTAKKWERKFDPSRVNFLDAKGSILGTVEGTFAVFEVEEK